MDDETRLSSSPLLPPTVGLAALRRTSGEAAWVIGGQVVSAIGLLVGVRVLTGVLDPVQYGHLSLGLTVGILTQQVIMGPLSGGFLRFYSMAIDRDERRSYLRAVGTLTRAGTMALVVPAAAALVLLAILKREWFLIGAASTVFATLMGLEIALDSMQNAARHRRVVAFHQALNAWLRLGFALLCVWLIGTTGAAALLGFALATGVVLVSQYAFYKRRIEVPLVADQGSRSNPDEWQHRMFRYSLSLMAVGVLAWGQLVSDRWGLKLFRGSDEVGYYAALYQIGFYPLLLLSGAVQQVVSPIFFSWTATGKDSGGLDRARSEAIRLAIVVVGFTLIGGAIAWLLREPIVELLLGEDFHRFAGLLPIFVLAGGFFAGAQVLASVALLEVRPAALVLPRSVTAVMAVALNLGAAYRFGVTGVAVSVLFSTIVYLIWVGALALRPVPAGAGS